MANIGTKHDDNYYDHYLLQQYPDMVIGEYHCKIRKSCLITGQIFMLEKYLFIRRLFLNVL